MPVAQPRPFPPLVFVLLPPCMGLRPVPLGPAGGAASTLPGATGWGLLPFAVLCSLFLLTLLPSLCPAQQLTGCSPPSASSPPHRLPTTSPPSPHPRGKGQTASCLSLPPVPVLVHGEGPRCRLCQDRRYNLAQRLSLLGQGLLAPPPHPAQSVLSALCCGRLSPLFPGLPQALLPWRSPTGGGCFSPTSPSPWGYQPSSGCSQQPLCLVQQAPSPLDSTFSKSCPSAAPGEAHSPAAPTRAVSRTAVQAMNQPRWQGDAGAGAARVLS